MRRWPKSAFAIAEENGEVWRSCIRNYQIKTAIPIEIAHCDVIGPRSCRAQRAWCPMEVSSSITQEHGQGLPSSADDDVWLAVMIYIGNGNGSWAVVNGHHHLIEASRRRRHARRRARSRIEKIGSEQCGQGENCTLHGGPLHGSPNIHPNSGCI
jgi:hypothetical protein